MTDQQADKVIEHLRWIRVMLAVLIGGLIGTAVAHAQTGPVLRHGDLLRAYIGPSQPSTRIYLWTTSSTSPNATAGPPWDEIGENPWIDYTANSVAVRQTGDPCLEPESMVPCRDTGWVDIPVPTGKILIGGQWIDDQWLRITIYVTDSPGCAVVACGARLVMARTSKADIVVMSAGGFKRRAVAP